MNQNSSIDLLTKDMTRNSEDDIDNDNTGSSLASFVEEVTK